MGTHNSLENGELKAYLSLFLASLNDVASIAPAYPKSEYRRDAREIERRAGHEGIQFLTRTLPSLAKAVDKALSNGTALSVDGFKRRKDSQVPLFMGWLIEQIFDDQGNERSDASGAMLMLLRQVLYFAYKLELPLDEKQCDEVIRTFKSTDADLPDQVVGQSAACDWIIRTGRGLIVQVLGGTDPMENLHPHHGPGAVSTREKSWQKRHFWRYYHGLHSVFCFAEHFVYNLAHLSLDYVTDLGTLSLEEFPEGTAKVVLVPKDSRGPRLISCEPLEYQWIQQGLKDTMVQTIESHPLTAGRVNFASQQINRDLALQASKDGLMVTLDMKDASDRVSKVLVEHLFPDTWTRALLGARTTATILPCGERVELKKFAPMGSATCFPVEAIVFWALSVASIMYTRPDITRREAASSVYVYGDDIICSKKDHLAILQYLPQFGLRFNEGKCCTSRSFRESCGWDAYHGTLVTPLRLKKRWSRHLVDTRLESWVALANNLNDKGLYHMAECVRSLTGLAHKLPYSDKPSSEAILCFCDNRKTARQLNRNQSLRRRYNKHLQRWETYGLACRPRVLDAGALGYSEMLRVASLKRRGGARMTPAGSREKLREIPSAQNYPKFLPEVPVVEAGQYALTRQATLRRVWSPMET